MQLVRAKKQKLSMDLAPLIDVVFQLLVFFMLTSTFANPAIKMVLPKAISADQTEQQLIIVSIDEKMEVYIDDEPVTLDLFQSRLSETLAEKDKKSIHIRGHKDMPYERFVRIMDLSRLAGATQVNILHKKGE